jgi:hypothetical protein
MFDSFSLVVSREYRITGPDIGSAFFTDKE